jgi:hypothetical protein
MRGSFKVVEACPANGTPVRLLILIVGALHLVTGFFMAIAPREFYDSLATFPPYNGHFLRDVSTFYLALGAMLVVAAGRRSWQIPLLALAVVQYALHVGSHLLDISDTEPAWKGPATAAFLAAITALLWWMLRRAATDRAGHDAR